MCIYYTNHLTFCNSFNTICELKELHHHMHNTTMLQCHSLFYFLQVPLFYTQQWYQSDLWCPVMANALVCLAVLSSRSPEALICSILYARASSA